MTIASGFFNSVNGDRRYTAEQITKFFDKLVGSGVFPNPSTNLQVLAHSGMTVKVSAGRGLIDCRWIENSADYLLRLPESNIAMPRIDRIVMRLDLRESVRSISIAIKTGTAAQNPVAPALTRTAEVKEYALADIRVGANTNLITQANITDQRGNSAVCGWITGLIDQIDGTTLFAQWQALFDEWFGQVRSEVTTSTLLREYRDPHTTTVQNQTIFTINNQNIPSFNVDLDILDVYVNGMKLSKDKQYTYTATTVMVMDPLDIGQLVEIVVFKSVDGYKAETLIKRVEDMERRIAALEAK